MNQLITNLKKDVSLRGTRQWDYKEQAIRQVGAAFRGVFNPQALPSMTFVPVPPSKAKDHPEYDDRMLRVLQQMAQANRLDIRELVLQGRSTQAAHKSQIRLQPQQLMALYAINETVAVPAPTSIFIVDDMLTAGCHFRAMKTVLQTRYPGVVVRGLFVARRAIPDADDDFDVIEEN
ncbi:hypothetical protein ACQCQ6_11325 [Ralstonia pseudosolanacearum]|uniref:hypothetical protein n=1 Tax=Ralstonia pseudosolanacearum TaxID=1310165 RepID=UPI002674E701|nr:hypothetical protein [Ralstonia pseudosolanacearum]MDO3512652.1 hypothetical protein [Ralstonia pseudosolanacearum]MDO3630326.1 hypothetical protein [Ralstonia pseudosolanacearum]